MWILKSLYHQKQNCFWFLVSKQFHNHSVIIHHLRLFRCLNVKVRKIHEKLMFSESQYCFVNYIRNESWDLYNISNSKWQIGLRKHPSLSIEDIVPHFPVFLSCTSPKYSFCASYYIVKKNQPGNLTKCKPMQIVSKVFTAVLS